MATLNPQHAQVLVPAGVAIVVVALTHFFTSARDRENKRREQRISYLVGVFRALCKANNHPRLYEVAEEVEQAIADIQLFGTPEQIRLVQQFATDLAKKQHAEMNALLESLRDSLRKEIGATRTNGHVVWFRVGRKQDNEN
ncbi:hypothetical protein [Chitinivorax sp. B]|uniref:hypothetical protein n=1 Tax=Chitinivorax sp. B TaxID=2502235 RepID=UPI0010F88BF7|nr:hypothetical protein [Chitinivorax sp. B]